VITLVLRDGPASCPIPRTRLRSGDSLLIVATADVRDAAERRLRAVSTRGRLARWLGEDGAARTDRDRDHGAIGAMIQSAIAMWLAATVAETV
jgi:hypothetical protein